jgi:hypothetical protein
MMSPSFFIRMILRWHTSFHKTPMVMKSRGRDCNFAHGFPKKTLPAH